MHPSNVHGNPYCDFGNATHSKGKLVNLTKTTLRMNLLVYLSVALVVLFTLAPILWMVLASFRTGEATMSTNPLDFEPTLANYGMLFGVKLQGATAGDIVRAAGFLPALLNSTIISVATTILSIAVGSTAAYAIARFAFRGRRAIATTILSYRYLPPITFVLPYFVIMQKLNLMDNFLAPIVADLVFSLPFTVWIVTSFIAEIPTEMEESAMVDGCSRFAAFTRVVLPLLGPGLAVAGIFTFIMTWNEFLIALTVTRTVVTPVTVIYSRFWSKMTTVPWGLTGAACVIGMLPLIATAVVLQKYIVRGLTLGAVK